MNKYQKLVVSALSCLPFAACIEDLGPPVCTADIRPSVIVEIYDATTGEPTASGARGHIRDGMYQDTLRLGHFRADMTLYALAAGMEKAGTFQVHVEKPGYQPWDTTGVRVRSGECHVETAQITARLRRS